MSALSKDSAERKTVGPRDPAAVQAASPSMKVSDSCGCNKERDPVASKREQADASDYECPICLDLLVDPVVGETCPTVVAPSQKHLSCRLQRGLLSD